MAIYDYVIVGAGAAGCVLANRLSADPTVSVALIEAGPRDTHPFISMPKGLAKVMTDPRHLWAYASKPDASTADKSEVWVRGRVLGGSTSINGMMYVRGQPADFDAIAHITSDDWAWMHIAEAYRQIENHELGAAPTRGDSGPLRLSVPDLRDRLSEAQVAAGVSMGLPRKEDVNVPDDDVGVGYAPRTIWKGRRQSAATAFIHPVRERANLTVLTDRTADRVLFEGGCASGVEVLVDGRREAIACRREVIVCGGAMASPAILERSGIGDRKRLESLGIPVVCHSPEVGEGLIEHRGLIVQWKLKDAALSQNRCFSGWRLLLATARYYLFRTGPMSSASYEIGAWMKSRRGLNRPDVQALIAPYSFDLGSQRTMLERDPGMNAVVYALRPTSRGAIHIETRDPDVAARFTPNHRATEEDRKTMIGAVRAIREWAAQPTIAELIAQETSPGSTCRSDEDILRAYDELGTCGYHAVGSCRMGSDPASVVDPRLRVRGVSRLRVMDTSVMPIIPAGNTNGPTMAMAWRGADLILEDAASG